MAIRASDGRVWPNAAAAADELGVEPYLVRAAVRLEGAKVGGLTLAEEVGGSRRGDPVGRGSRPVTNGEHVWKSAAEAARHFRVTRQCISERVHKGDGMWYSDDLVVVP